MIVLQVVEKVNKKLPFTLTSKTNDILAALDKINRSSKYRTYKLIEVVDETFTMLVRDLSDEMTEETAGRYIGKLTKSLFYDYDWLQYKGNYMFFNNLLTTDVTLSLSVPFDEVKECQPLTAQEESNKNCNKGIDEELFNLLDTKVKKGGVFKDGDDALRYLVQRYLIEK